MDVLIQATAAAFSWSAIVALIVGTLAGIIIGGLPGLGSVVGLTIFLPFTFGMDTMPSMALLLGVYCGSVYGGSITAIVINTPGTPQAAATALDGYALTQAGQTDVALGWATLASVFGGITSCLILMVAAPQLARFAVKFGSIEVFALICLAMLCIVGISAGNTLKGLIAGCIGFFMSLIGTDPITGASRFTFDNYALNSGLALIPVVIGVFALSEVLVRLADRGHGENRLPDISLRFPSLREIGRRIVELLRGSIIGSLVGALPGTGAATAAFMSYATAGKVSPRRNAIGRGEPDGIIAAESANNAVTGSAFIPTLALGIPGDVVTAMMMGAMIIHGITPGVRLMADESQTVYGLFALLIAVNLALLVLSKPTIQLFRYIFRLPEGFVMAGVVTFSFIGAAAVRGNPLDVLTMVATGIGGYLLRRAGFPLAPLVIGMVLGPQLESSLRRGLLIERGDFLAFFTHSWIATALFALIGLGICATIVSELRSSRARARQRSATTC